jgi:hypothetical protein
MIVNNLLKYLAVLILAMVLSSCSTPAIDQVTGNSQTLQLERYFAGKTMAHGLLLDRSGTVTRYFDVEIIGTWSPEKQTLVLDESFVFNDGEHSKRIWTITKHSPNHYTGTASDVVGTANGLVNNNVLNWQYYLQVPYQGQVLNIHFDDWLYLINDRVVLNKATMTKWGFKVGEIIITFEKP